MGRGVRVTAGSLVLAAAAVAPMLSTDRLEVPLPRGILPLPFAIEYRAATLSVSDGGISVDLFDVRARDPEGRFSLFVPHAVTTLDGRIAVRQPQLELAQTEAKPPERTDAAATADAVRRAVVELASSLPIDRIASISITGLAVVAGGREWTEGARADLAREGGRLRGLVHLGTALPDAELFATIRSRSIEMVVELEDARVEVVQRFDDRGVELRDLRLSLDGTEIAGAGWVAPSGYDLDLTADRASIAGILRRWPRTFEPEARAFVEAHVRRGTVSNARVLARDGDFALDFGFSGVRAELRELPLPITAARGRGHLTPEGLALSVRSARIGGVSASGSVRVDGLRPRSGRPGRLAIDARLRGPAAGALRLLPEPPLPPEEVAGKADLRVLLSGPLDHELGALAIDVRGRARDLALRNVRLFDRFRVSEGDVAVTANPDRLELEGRASLNGVPATVSWSSSGRARVRATLDSGARRALGIGELEGLEGPVTADLEISFAGERAWTRGTLDLSAAVLRAPLLGFNKPAGESAQAELSAECRADGALSIRRFSLEARDLSAEGSLELDAARRVKSLRMRVRRGENDFWLSARGDQVLIYGDAFDARPLLKHLRHGDPGGSQAPRTIRVDLTRVWVTDQVGFDRVSGMVRLKSGRIREMKASARIGGTKVSLSGEPRGSGLEITARAGDTGLLAAGLGIRTSLSGGRAIVRGVLAEDLAFEGRAVVYDLEIDKPSTALSILSATSIAGIIDLLRGNRLRFGRADVRFSVLGSKLTIAEALFSGGPIGLATHGKIDLGSGDTRLVARVAPLDDVNRLIRMIPVLGKLLAPKGDALLLAPSVAVEGDLEHVDVRLRPQSLIPAFIRRLFD